MTSTILLPGQLRFRIAICQHADERKCFRSDRDQPGRRQSRPGARPGEMQEPRLIERVVAYNPGVLDGPINSDGQEHN